MEEVYITEVSPRDGFQSIPYYIDSGKKVEYINSLSECGFKRIEVTSFVKKDIVPQLQDAEIVLKSIKRFPATVYSVFVPNLIGAKRAIGCGADELSVFVSASEAFSIKNINKNITDSLKEISKISAEAYNNNVKLRVSIAMAFKCPFEGDIPVERVVSLARNSCDIGATEICICDTSGEAEAENIINLSKNLKLELKDIPISFHFHLKKDNAKEKVSAAIGQGCSIFDSALGDIGGCPNTPSFLKNVSTVDLINICNEKGIRTSINVEKLKECLELLKTILREN